jgi:aldehyde dehydrogenase
MLQQWRFQCRCGQYSEKEIAMFQHAIDLVRSKGKLPARYGNFIGGNWVTPADGECFTDYSPINGERLVNVAKSTAPSLRPYSDSSQLGLATW